MALTRMREPCPVCGAIMTEFEDHIAQVEVERAADPEGYHQRLLRDLRERDMHGIANRLEAMPTWAVDQDREDALLRALGDLVRLKDGPRDDHYREVKDAAWERARELTGMTQ